MKVFTKIGIYLFWGVGMFATDQLGILVVFPILRKFRTLFGDTIGLSFSSSVSLHIEA